MVLWCRGVVVLALVVVVCVAAVASSQSLRPTSLHSLSSGQKPITNRVEQLWTPQKKYEM